MLQIICATAAAIISFQAATLRSRRLRAWKRSRAATLRCLQAAVYRCAETQCLSHAKVTEDDQTHDVSAGSTAPSAQQEGAANGAVGESWRALQQLHSMKQDEDAAVGTSVAHDLVQQDVSLRISGAEGCNACIPLSVVRRADSAGTLPVVIWLHATGASTASMMPRVQKYARSGFLAVAMDCRYHGRRSLPGMECRHTYQEAIFSMDGRIHCCYPPVIAGGEVAYCVLSPLQVVCTLSRAWQQQHECPFILDNVRDLRLVLDYLETRSDVDPQRIGMAGVSLGGMHTWLCAALDDRIAAAAPMIGVQSFKWALENNHFQGRVDSLKRAFEMICKACDKAEVDAAVVQSAWERLLPGLLESYDSPQSLPCVAPRPLMVVNGAKDPRCPVAGLVSAFAKCKDVYRLYGKLENFEVHIADDAGHETTPEMDAAVEQFFVRHLMTATS